MLSIAYTRTSNVLLDVNVGANYNYFNIPLILDKYDIMIVMQESKLCRNLLLLSMQSDCIAICMQNSCTSAHVQNMLYVGLIKTQEMTEKRLVSLFFLLSI